MATLGLFYAVAHWNSWFPAVIYLNERKKLPLQVVLRNFIIMGTPLEGTEITLQNRDNPANEDVIEVLKYGTLFISLVPMMILYPFLQKYFVKGVMIGSLKG